MIKHQSAIDPILIDVPTTCAKLSIGRTTAYALLAKGTLQRVKIGSKTLVTMESIRALTCEKHQPLQEEPEELWPVMMGTFPKARAV